MLIYIPSWLLNKMFAWSVFTPSIHSTCAEMSCHHVCIEVFSPFALHEQWFSICPSGNQSILSFAKKKKKSCILWDKDGHDFMNIEFHTEPSSNCYLYILKISFVMLAQGAFEKMLNICVRPEYPFIIQFIKLAWRLNTIFCTSVNFSFMDIRYLIFSFLPCKLFIS